MIAALAEAVMWTAAYLAVVLVIGSIAHRINLNLARTERDRIMAVTNNPLIAPRVNLNGTSKEALIRQYMDVYHALGVVLTHMHDATPHGRDYQTFSDAAQRTYAARDAWGERQLIIEAMRREIEELAINISEQ